MRGTGTGTGTVRDTYNMGFCSVVTLLWGICIWNSTHRICYQLTLLYHVTFTDCTSKRVFNNTLYKLFLFLAHICSAFVRDMNSYLYFIILDLIVYIGIQILY